MALIITLFFVAFLSRFTMALNAGADFDSYGHLYFAKEVKKQKTGPFGKIKINVVEAEDLRAPFVWHWIVGLFNYEKTLQLQKWINPTLDACYAMMIFLFARWAGFNLHLSFLVSLLYLLTPMWFSRLSMGPRLRSFTPRLSFELITNIFFIVTVLPLSLPLWIIYLCGSLLIAFIVLSSKFSLQAILFLVPLTSLLALNPLPVYVMLLGFLLAIVVTKGRFFKTVNSQFSHLLWYFRKNIKGETVVSKRNNLSEFRKKLKSSHDPFWKIQIILNQAIQINSHTGLIIKMPIIFVGIFLYAMAMYRFANYPYAYLSAPVISAVIIYILISLPPLLFLGEAERYLNHVAFFIVAMATLLAKDLDLVWILYFVLGYGALYWAIESFFLRRGSLLFGQKKLTDDNDKAIISNLISIKHPLVVLSYPFHAVGVWRILAETNHHVFYNVLMKKTSQKTFERNFDADYPFVKIEKLDEIASQYGVNYLIIDKNKLNARGLKDWSPSKRWKRQNIGQPIYDVYQRFDTLSF